MHSGPTSSSLTPAAEKNSQLSHSENVLLIFPPTCHVVFLIFVFVYHCCVCLCVCLLVYVWDGGVWKRIQLNMTSVWMLIRGNMRVVLWQGRRRAGKEQAGCAYSCSCWFLDVGHSGGKGVLLARLHVSSLYSTWFTCSGWGDSITPCSLSLTHTRLRLAVLLHCNLS